MPVSCFGPFSFDHETLVLRRDDAVVPLEPQPARLLALLIEEPGRVVTREEIIARLWPTGTHVNFAESLHYSVRRIRIALGEHSKRPSYVHTLPRLGYRFAAPVHRPDDTGGRTWRVAVAAGVAGLAIVAALESTPNNHHEQAVRAMTALHRVLF